ncbi:MAG: carbonic anhydrase [Gemmatimonadota bacterium]|nr:carbonic anhydrase [Gemmatimonadota bacterium]
MGAIDDCLQANAEFVGRGDAAAVPVRPSRRLAIVTCMDCRLELTGALGLRSGDAHMIRNAGGVVTEDVIRSLTLSQALLGTREIMLIHHTNCGLLASSDDALGEAIEDAIGSRPPFALSSFDDVEADVRRCLAVLNESPLIVHDQEIRGFVYDVETGQISEVAPE